jgi:CheY-like chemotaxis protein
MAPLGGGVRTLLVVEDNDAAREWAALLLRDGGYAVATAANGQEALEYLRAGPPPDLILLDMLMPGLDGWHFLEQFQRDGPPAPVLVTTGTILTREWAEAHACRGFLHKPFEPEALLEEVHRCLSSTFPGGALPP